MSEEKKEDAVQSPPHAPVAAGAVEEVSHEESAAPPSHEGAPTQEDLARRVEALAKDETEADRIARIEEQKLAERRAAQKAGQKAGKKKSGLAEAASRKLDKIGAAKPLPAARAVPADPLLARTNDLGAWAKRNAAAVRVVVGLAVVGVAGAAGYGYWQQKREAEASAVLTAAIVDERGRIGDPDRDTSQDRFKDPTPVFKTADDRREAALKEYREVVRRFPGTGAAMLARLSEASILLDKRDGDGALAAYTEVKGSPLGAADVQVRARALEGMGFANELKGQNDAALDAFKQLEATDLLGFKELGMYHEARVYEAKGDKDKAKELLKSVHERLEKASADSKSLPYLRETVEDRLRALDPTALPPKASNPFGRMGMPGMGGPGGQQMSPEQMRQLMEMMRKQGAGAPAGHP